MVFLFFLTFLFLPYFILTVSSFLSWSSSAGASLDYFQSFDEILWAIKNSLIQSGLSTLGSLLVGTFLFVGMHGFVQRMARLRSGSFTGVSFVRLLLLVPNLLPTLLVVFMLLEWVQPFPMGIVGVTLAHVFVNAGLVAFLLDQIFQSRWVPMSELSLVFGSSQWLFLKKIFFSSYRDFLQISGVVFVTCFSSFTIPLLLGGGKATTLEILIYEKMKISSDYSSALGMGVLQMMILSVWSFLNEEQMERREVFWSNSSLLGGKFSSLFFILYGGLPILAFLFNLPSSYEHFNSIDGLRENVLELAAPSFLFSFFVSVGLFFMMALLLKNLSSKRIVSLVKGFSSPSTSLMGLALLFGSMSLNKYFLNIPEKMGMDNYFSGVSWIAWALWIFGVISMFFPVLFKWGWGGEIESLHKQIETAIVLGANQNFIFRKILLPQLAEKFAWISGVAGVWALGDFAFGRILLERTATWAMLSESLLSSYRLGAGLFIMAMALIGGLLQLVIFLGVARVYRQWIEKNIF